LRVREGDTCPEGLRRGTCPTGLGRKNMHCKVREGGACFQGVGWVRLG